MPPAIAEWLAHKGTVGKIVLGELAVLDDDMQAVPQGQPGTLWFKTATNSNTTMTGKDSGGNVPDGEMTTVSDVGYVDEDGFVFNGPEDIHDHFWRREYLSSRM